MKYQNYLQTDYWKAVALAVKKRAGYRCQICNSQHDLQAHHRCYDNRGRELEHLDDLTCLCRRCHAIFHGQLPAVPVEKGRDGRIKMRPESKQADAAWVEANLPAGDLVTLTAELVMKCRTPRNGFTNATLRALDVRPPLIKGWVGRLVGKQVSRESYRQALMGRTIYNSGALT
jgi:hypothetical protein